MVIIEGHSAIAFWRTPPLVRDAELPQETIKQLRALFGNSFRRSYNLPKNASAASRQIYERAFTELKGIPLPISVLSERKGANKNPYVRERQLVQPIPRQHLHDLGGGLYVASPALALQQVMLGYALPQRLELINEMCGLYALFYPTNRCQRVLNDLHPSGQTQRISPTGGAYACFDANGQYEPTTDQYGNDLVWAPALDRAGHLTDLWKRPPIIRVEQLVEELSDLTAYKGNRAARLAVRFALDGAGSPLETKLALLLYLPARYGGECWRRPLLNKRIIFDQRARELSGTSSCIGDQVWENPRAVIEVNGLEYHADRDGFRIHSGRTAALQSMGYSVLEIDYQQMSDLTRFDTVIETFSRILGFPLQKRTARFLAKRDVLHQALFSKRNMLRHDIPNEL